MYLVDTHSAVGLAVARKYRSYTDSERPLLVCATAHYAKSLHEVFHAVTSSQPSAVNCDGLRSLSETLSTLEQRVKSDTRPVMNEGLRSVVDYEAAQTTTVLPAQIDAIAAHIHSLA